MCDSLAVAGISGGNLLTIEDEHVELRDYCCWPGSTSIEIGRMISISANKSLRGFL